jgi:hypothetical protein
VCLPLPEEPQAIAPARQATKLAQRIRFKDMIPPQGVNSTAQ